MYCICVYSTRLHKDLHFFKFQNLTEDKLIGMYFFLSLELLQPINVLFVYDLTSLAPYTIVI